MGNLHLCVAVTATFKKPPNEILKYCVIAVCLIIDVHIRICKHNRSLILANVIYNNVTIHAVCQDI